MGDRPAMLGGARAIDMDPLVIVGGVGEGLDAGRHDDLERVAALVSPAELGSLLLDGEAIPSPARIDWLIAQGADCEARDADGDTAAFRLLARGPVRLSDVEAAQKEILTIVRRMADEGVIALNGGGSEELV